MKKPNGSTMKVTIVRKEGAVVVCSVSVYTNLDGKTRPTHKD